MLLLAFTDAPNIFHSEQTTSVYSLHLKFRSYHPGNDAGCVGAFRVPRRENIF